MASENITLYIKGDRNVEVTEQDVFLKDIVSMECSDKKFLPKLQTVKILKLHGNREQRYVVSVLEIIACIHATYPEVEVQNLGEVDIIVTYENQKTPPYIWHILKVAVVAAIIFFGSAFSIMAFNNDIGIKNLFGQLYEMFTGRESDGFTLLEISYSIGVGLGILIFFHHFAKKQGGSDPTPLEVEMRTYEDDVDATLIESGNRKEGKRQKG